MSGFPLLALPPVLQEQIITKLHWKSYFRLQQTCRYVGQFVRKSKDFRYHLGSDCCLEIGSALFCLTSNEEQEYTKSPVDVKSLYGCRVNMICFDEQSVNFEDLCDNFKDNKITSTSLFLYGSRFTKEDCMTLFKLLKPVDVDIHSEESDRYQALYHLKNPENVRVRLNPNDIAREAQRLLSIFPKVTIKSVHTSDQFNSMRTILKLFYTKSFPNLRNFDFFGCGGESLPTQEELEERFEGFKLTMEENTRDEISAQVDMPNSLPYGFSCKISFKQMNGTVASIHYGVDWSLLRLQHENDE